MHTYSCAHTACAHLHNHTHVHTSIHVHTHTPCAHTHTTCTHTHSCTHKTGSRTKDGRFRKPEAAAVPVAQAHRTRLRPLFLLCPWPSCRLNLVLWLVNKPTPVQRVGTLALYVPSEALVSLSTKRGSAINPIKCQGPGREGSSQPSSPTSFPILSST